jgi:hypothetical protein
VAQNKTMIFNAVFLSVEVPWCTIGAIFALTSKRSSCIKTVVQSLKSSQNATKYAPYPSTPIVDRLCNDKTSIGSPLIGLGPRPCALQESRVYSLPA